MAGAGTFDEAMHRFRMDAARWVVPESVAPIEDVTPRRMLQYLYRYPNLRAMAWFRFGNWAASRGVRGIGPYVQRRLLRLYALELVIGQEIGGGLYIGHPAGCTLVADRIGENVTVIGAATFGMREETRWPVIEDGVFVGVGARVLGGITLGRGAKVGANAVVITDVPAGATAVGIPARILPPRSPAAADSASG